MKYLMLMCTGVNIPVVVLGIVLNSPALTFTGFMSGTACYLSYYLLNKNESK
jgi:hypothetical protein